MMGNQADNEATMSEPRRSAARPFGGPQALLAVIGLLLVVWGVVGLATNGWTWQPPVHIGLGLIALAGAAVRRVTKPVAILMFVAFLALFFVDVAVGASDQAPALPGFGPMIAHIAIWVASIATVMWPTRKGRPVT